MNPYTNNFNSYYPQQSPYGFPFANAGIQQAPMQVKTNKIFVTSLEDALSRYAEPNSVMVYRHQDETKEFEITTDPQGKKNYRTIVLSDFNPVQAENAGGMQIHQEEFESLKRRISALESKFEKPKKEKAGGLSDE